MIPDRKSIADYFKITSGVLGRLAISLVYFLIVANALSVGDFGLFAAAAAVGLILSRLLAFGFISPVYRVATVKPRLLGAYWSGLALFTVLSLPVIGAAAAAIHHLLFVGKIEFAAFLAVIGAEVLGIRVMEFVAITLNGLSRFGPAARLVIIASSLRTVAAIAFLMSGLRSLDAWAAFNLASALAVAVVAILLYLPKFRWRLRLALYFRRLRDAVTTAASELAFYAQAELDKVVVLSVAGERAAGIYAIAMRLIDLTAIPVRSFSQMLVQKTMRERPGMVGLRRSALIEAGIATISVTSLAGFLVLLWPDPALLGGNVARAAPVLLPMLLIPAFRNLVEFHGELLYAREMVVSRLSLLCGLTAVKLALVAAITAGRGNIGDWALQLTIAFAVVYALSALVTYGRLRASAR